jgi:hypothetical protein
VIIIPQLVSVMKNWLLSRLVPWRDRKDSIVAKELRSLPPATFTVEQSLPPSQGTNGGIALIGWSMGSLHAHAVVAYLDTLPPNVLSDL